MLKNKALIEDLKKVNIDINSLSNPNKNNMLELINMIEDKYNSEEELNVVINNSPCTISIISSDLKYIKVNELLAKITKVPASEFIGRNLGDLTKDTNFLNFIKDLFNSEEVVLKREIVAVIHNQRKFFYVVGQKIKEGSAAVVIGLDVSDFKELEASRDFYAGMASLGELVAGITHEINSPLMALKLNADSLNMSLNDGEDIDLDKAKKNITNIQRMIDSISGIIKSVKSYSRKSNLNETVLTGVSLDNVIKSAMLITCGKTKRYKIKVLFDESCSNLVVSADETALLRTIIILINNSSDAIKDLQEKKIEIKAAVDVDNVFVKIIDSGDGIPEEILDKIFNPFFTTKRIGEGNGIGLNLAKQMIESMNGRIFYSKENNNTCFNIQLKKGELCEKK